MFLELDILFPPSILFHLIFLLLVFIFRLSLQMIFRSLSLLLTSFKTLYVTSILSSECLDLIFTGLNNQMEWNSYLTCKTELYFKNPAHLSFCVKASSFWSNKKMKSPFDSPKSSQLITLMGRSASLVFFEFFSFSVVLSQ